jgi:chondroitin 4-sulfotransferase 11
MKILFGNIPKCSSTNINDYLQKKDNINYVWFIYRILKYKIQTYDSYYKFSIIRDPIEKLVSLYLYQINFINYLKTTDLYPIYQEGNWQKVENLYKKYNIKDITSFLNNYTILYNNETNDTTIYNKYKIKILFCHIPKCSGTNINDYLQKKDNIDYVWYIHRILKYEIQTYDSYYKFAIIRDPIERLVSLYFYTSNGINYLKTIDTFPIYQEGNWQKLDNLYKKYNFTDITSFLNNYTIFYNNEIKPEILNLKYHNETKEMAIYYIVGFLPQYLFICDDNFNLLVDDIVNIKDIDTFMYDKFEIKLDKKIKLNGHKNSNDNYYDYLTEKNINDIKEIYKEDYKYLHL